MRQAFCHCHECQRASGSAFAAIAAFPFDKVRITKGTPIFFDTERLRGGKNGRGFCGTCGSRLFSGNDGVVMGIMAASLDDPSLFNPTAHAFMSHARDWDPTKDKLPKFDTYLS